MSTGTGQKTFLRWSPDQLTVAFAQVISGTQVGIWLADVTGASSLQVTFPSVSQSDGFGHDFYRNAAGAQYLIYSRDGQLFSMFFNGTQPATAITSASPSTKAAFPAVSPNNKLLAYRHSFTHGALGTMHQVQVVDIGTWQSRYGILLPAMIKQGTASAIAFSCDSERVFVAAEPAAGPAGTREIYSVNLDGSDWERLTNNSVFDSQPNAVPRPCGFTLWPF
jgi:Tol biopolymer transport system component